MVDWRKITVADNVGFYKLPFLFTEVLATLTESRTEGELQMNGKCNCGEYKYNDNHCDNYCVMTTLNLVDHGPIFRGHPGTLPDIQHLAR